MNRFGDAPADAAPSPATNRFGDSPADMGQQSSSVNRFGDAPAGPPPAPSADQRFQASPGVQQNADDYVQQKWAQFGRVAQQSQGQAIRDYAQRVYGATADQNPERDLTAAVGYVKSSVPLDQAQQLEQQWRREYLAQSLPQAVGQQQAAANPPQQQQVGGIHGIADKLLAGTADVLLKPVEAGTQLFYATGDHSDNSGLHGARGNLTPNEMHQLASMGFLNQVQGKVDATYPGASNAGAAQHFTENVAEMLPQLLLTGKAFQAGGAQKVLALTQMGSSGFSDAYKGLWDAAKAKGMSDQDANAAALGGGLVESVADTYLMKFGALGQAGTASGSLLRRVAVNAAKDALAQGLVGGGQGLINEATAYVTTGKSPQFQAILDSAIQNAGAGAAFGAAHAVGEKPVAPAPSGPPVPDAATMKTLVENPSVLPDAAPNAEEAKSYPKLESSQPKYRNNDKQTGQSFAGPINFEHPDDKALYVATHPRQGKATQEAVQYLKDQGYTDEQIQNQGQAVRDQVTQRVQPLRGEPAAISRIVQDHQPATGPGVEAAAGPPGPPTVTVTETAAQPGPAVGDEEVNRAIADLPRIRPNAVVVTPGKLVRAASAVAEKTLGIRVVHVNDSGNAAGFTDPAHPGIAFIDARNPVESWVSVLAHEWMHTVQNADPVAAGQFYDAIPDKQKQAYLDSYKQKLAGLQGVDAEQYLTPQRVRREVGAMALGDAATRGRVRRAIMGQDPTLWDRIVDAFGTLKDKLSGKSGIIDKALGLIEEKGSGKAEAPEQNARTSKEVQTAGTSYLPKDEDEQRILAAHREGEKLKSANDPAADHQVAETQKMLAEYGERHGEDAMEDLFEKMQGANHHPGEADASSGVSFMPEHHDRIREEAEEYTRSHGVPYQPDHTYAPVDETRAKKIAALYDLAEHDPNRPDIKRSYDAFKRESLDQFNYLQKKGVNFQEWKGEGQPYKDSAEMRADARDNKHLWFFTGGDLPSDHPLSERAPGTPYSYNDVFRAVHDYFGHAKEGYGFGPRGEENAWRSHSQLYSDVARPAMTTETRGQNSWVNFGPKGEQNRANPANTQYAQQKAAILPEQYNKVERPDGTSYLPSPVKTFVDEDVAPAAAELKERVANAWEGVKGILAPQTRSEGAAKSAGVLREMGADLAQRLDRLGAAFDEAKTFMGKQSVADNRDFTAAMEHGEKQPDPALQPLADSLRAILDDRLKQVQDLGTGKLQQFIQNYFPHLWKDPKKAGEVYQQIIGKTPIQGAKNFLKQRTHEFQSDGLAAGLEPLTENPVEAAMLRVREMDKYITAQRAFGEMKDMGLMQKVPARKVYEAKKNGLAQINDGIATIFAPPNRRGGVSIAGYWMAPDPVANVLNNYLSPGLRGNEKFGGAFRAYLGAGNVMNQVQLGMSGFHLAMTTLDSATSKLALGFRQLGSGQLGEAGKSFLRAGTVFGPAIGNIRNGNLVLREWLHPGTTTPEIAQVVDAMKAAGGRVKMDDFYHTGMTDKMMDAFRKGNILGGIVRAPLAGLEQAAKPLMEQIVPRMKIGVFMDLAKYELAKLGPDAGRDEVRAAMGRAWDSVDNRMGEMVYDNLFWNKAVKDLSMASVRSVGWNLGTIRELGGGVYDLAKNAAVAANDRSFNNTEFTHRMAYTAAMPIMAGLVGGSLHYLLNGQAPASLKDWFYPQTGEKDKDGHAVRMALPSYMKDVLSYGKDFRDAWQTGDLTNAGRTLADKTHPLLNTLWDMLRNEDYYGTKIRNEDDPFLKRMADEAKFVGKQFLPFGIRQAGQLAQQGQGARSLLPLVGVVKARHDITNTPAENTAFDLMRQRLPVGSRTQEQVGENQRVRDLASSLRNKEPDARQKIREAYQAGQLTDEDVTRIRQGANSPGLLEGTVRRLDVKDAMKVWDDADAGERKRLGPIMLSKIRGSRSLTRTEQVALMKRFEGDWRALQAGPSSEEQ